MKTIRLMLAPALVLALIAIPAASFALQEDARLTATDTEAVSDRPVFDALKERALALIGKQQDALGRLRSAIANSHAITNEHAAQLLGDIGAASAALDELAREIGAASTFAELTELIRQIDDFQIGHVLAPKTYQVIASDTLVAVGGKLDRFSNKLERLIGRAEDVGFDVDEAWRMLDTMDDLVAEGVRLADPVAESVIGLQPADWPEPAQGVLGDGHSDLEAAQQSLRDARRTGWDIIQFLRDLVGGDA